MSGDRLQQLTTEYVRRAREELALLHALMQPAQAGQAEALADILRLIHGINGSGALLGFKQISEHASQIERILRRAETQPNAAEWQLIQQLLAQIEMDLREYDGPATHE